MDCYTISNKTIMYYRLFLIVLVWFRLIFLGNTMKILVHRFIALPTAFSQRLVFKCHYFTEYYRRCIVTRVSLQRFSHQRRQCEETDAAKRYKVDKTYPIFQQQMHSIRHTINSKWINHFTFNGKRHIKDTNWFYDPDWLFAQFLKKY